MRRRFTSQFLGMNSVVVYQDNNGYLIDPGVFPQEIEKIKTFLNKEDIHQIVILLTHTHGDHISGWNAFQNYPSYCHESISQKSQDVRNNDVRYLQGMYRKNGFEDFDQLKFPENIYYMAEGEFKVIPPASFAFFHLPGHSTDMSAIVIKEEKLLFSGDMLIQSPTPYILHSINEYWESLNSINELVYKYDIHCLIPGHGKPARNKDEMLFRINNEQKYIKKLVTTGIEIFQRNPDLKKFKEEFLYYFGEFKDLHSHQINVQTLMREINDLTSLSDLLK
jgi:hydroxyacylglutathione hydrolase